MKAIILGLLGLSVLSTVAMPPAWAVKTAIEASGNVSMNSALKSYQDNVLQSITKECLAQKAAKATFVSLTVDPHGNIMKIVISNSGLSSAEMINLITGIKALKLGDAGEKQSDTLRITMDFDLAEVLAGAKSTGTSISIKGGSITGDGTTTGGIRIGGTGSITSGGAGSITSGGGNIAINEGAIPALPRNLSPRRTSVTPDALNKLAALEQSPDSNLQDLCNARLVLVPQYWRDEDHDKAKSLLEQALKYLEGPAGPLSRETTRNFQRITPLLIQSPTAGDQDLIWRIFAVIETKAQGGCTDYDLSQLSRRNLTKGSEQNADVALSIFSRLLELRETREGTGSIKLMPILSVLVTTNESQHKYAAALVLQQRVGKIQKQNGIGGDAEAMNLLTEARLYALDGKFEQAKSSEKKALEVASQAQTTDPLKGNLVPGLAALSSAYVDKGNKLDEADRVVREAVDMVSQSTPGRNGNDFVIDSCIATLTDKYRQSKQFQPAINLLEYLLEKPNRSTRTGSTNTWRYRLAGLYLDQSNAATGKSTHRSKTAIEMLRKSKLYFDTAQDISKNDRTRHNPTPEQFLRERIESMRNYGMTEEANELEKQQEAGSPIIPDRQNARPEGAE